MSLLLRSDIRQYRFVLFYEPGYCVTRLLAFTARAIARFAANLALTAGVIVLLVLFAPGFAGFTAPISAWNVAQRFLSRDGRRGQIRPEQTRVPMAAPAPVPSPG